MVIRLEGKKEENREGMTKVRASDENGDFVKGGKIGWIPSRLLDWKTQEEKKPEPAVVPEVKPSSQNLTGSDQTMVKGLNINLAPNQILTVDDSIREGQKWRFSSFNGPFFSRIDTGDNSSCWKEINNTLPWQADATGKLQIKAGNMPVAITIVRL